MKKDFTKCNIGLETGGTNINCIIATSPQNIITEYHIPTGDPAATTSKIIDFIQSESQKLSLHIESMGIGSFGPLRLDHKDPDYGSIAVTPKLDWRNYPLLTTFSSVFDFPILIDTDVNAALLGELSWGAGIGLSDFVYVTIGTGIGGGVLANGQLIHGTLHPEIGHMFLKHDLNLDPFPGICPYHADCLEGLANGPSIAKRWGMPAQKLPGNHPGWAVEADYLAQMCVNLTLMLSPQKIILGGGVSQHHGLLPMIRNKFREKLNNYVVSSLYNENLESFIVSPKLGQKAGVLGALALAQTIK